MPKSTKTKKGKPRKTIVKTTEEVKQECYLNIVKRGGRSEIYDERKVYATCYNACKAVPIDKYKCEVICEKVVDEVNKWICDKGEVDSTEIFEFVSKTLNKYDEAAAYMYATHRDIA